jgi:predicted DNA-binding transcriptional regulator AlpA
MSDTALTEPLKIIDEREAAKLNGVSYATWQRMKASGDAPPSILISKRRLGYRLADIKEWQDKRLRK